jgi:hypothetical protein
VDGDRVLRPPARVAVSLREHLSPTGQPPLWWLSVESPSPMCRPPPVAACGVAEPDVPAPTPVGACGVAAPDEAACVSASTDAVASNACPARRDESWKSSIIARCCSYVGWVTGGGSRQLCTTDLVSAAAQQVGQRKLHRWFAASVVVI